MSALAACHSFWLVLLGIPASMVCYSAPLPVLRVVGWAALSIGLAVVAAVGLWEYTQWLPRVAEWQQDYFLQRWMFVIAGLVDVPIMQSALLGVLCLATAAVRRQRKQWRFLRSLVMPTEADYPDFTGNVPAD